MLALFRKEGKSNKMRCAEALVPCRIVGWQAVGMTVLAQRISIIKELGRMPRSSSPVRSRTPSVLDKIRDGTLVFGYEPRPAIVACDALPGSPEKIDELAARLECGESLWHPNDRNEHPSQILTTGEWEPGHSFLAGVRRFRDYTDDEF